MPCLAGCLCDAALNLQAVQAPPGWRGPRRFQELSQAEAKAGEAGAGEESQEGSSQGADSSEEAEEEKVGSRVRAWGRE